MKRPAFSLRLALGLIALVGAATVGAALLSEIVFGFVPCKLCLLERRPYYLAVPLALIAIARPLPRSWVRNTAWLVAAIFAVGAVLGAYHAGAEWGWWAGPSDCGGGSGPGPADVGDFLKSLNGTRVVSCTDAAWRFAGISLAGWNAVISFALACAAGWAASRTDPQGSSSVSQ